MLWWRVEFTGEGGIKSCDQVEAAQKGQGAVCFVQASTKTDAVIAAQAWAKERRERIKARSKEQRDRAQRHGMCTMCKRELARDGKKTCGPCGGKTRPRRPNPLPRRPHKQGPELSDLEYYAQYQRSQKVARENQVLKAPCAAAEGRMCSMPYAHIVLEHFDRLGPEGFRAWLVEKIEASKVS